MTEGKVSTATSQGEPPKPKSDQTSAAEFPICSVCGSERIVRDAWVSWDAESKDFEAAAMTTVHLRELGVGRIICRAESSTRAFILKRIGAHEVPFGQLVSALIPVGVVPYFVL